jgi:hypothetical protein
MGPNRNGGLNEPMAVPDPKIQQNPHPPIQNPQHDPHFNPADPLLLLITAVLSSVHKKVPSVKKENDPPTKQQKQSERNCDYGFGLRR